MEEDFLFKSVLAWCDAHLPNCVVALTTRTDWTGSNGFITHTITVRAVRLDGSYGKQHPYSKTTAAPEKARDAGQLADVYPILGRKFTRIDLILSNFFVFLHKTYCPATTFYQPHDQ